MTMTSLSMRHLSSYTVFELNRSAKAAKVCLKSTGITSWAGFSSNFCMYSSRQSSTARFVICKLLRMSPLYMDTLRAMKSRPRYSITLLMLMRRSLRMIWIYPRVYGSYTRRLLPMRELIFYCIRSGKSIVFAIEITSRREF